MKKIYSYYDRLKEPKRFLIFLLISSIVIVLSVYPPTSMVGMPVLAFLIINRIYNSP